VVAAIVSTAAVCYGISATSRGTYPLLQFVRWPAVITAATMLIMCASTIAVALGLNAAAPGVVGDMTSYYTFTLLNVTILMTLATIAAIVAAAILIRQPSTPALA
jgi:hypothetical protein